MTAYALRRLVGVLITLLFGITLTFFAVHLAPGDPTAHFLDPAIGAELRERIVVRFGLNDPLHIQYFAWLKRVVIHFDFGNSFQSGREASDVVLDALPPTLLLTGLALLLGLILGIIGGVLSAVYHGRATDRIVTAVMLFFYSMPPFWLGMMFLGVFAIWLDWLPASQLTSVFHDRLSLLGRLGDYIKHLALPVTSLALASAGAFGRFVRTSMIESMNSDYVVAARSRGITESRILVQYGLRNALIPLITLVGLTVPVLFSGVVVIEVIFSLPGMGRVMVDAVLSRDYPVILASSTLAFLAVLVGNLLADIGYAIADPRVRVRQQGIA